MDKAEQSSISFFQALREPSVVARGLRVAAVVGTLLTLINQGDLLFAGQFPPLWKILLTFFVPYGVSTYSSAAYIVGMTKA